MKWVKSHIMLMANLSPIMLIKLFLFFLTVLTLSSFKPYDLLLSCVVCF